MHEMHVEVVGFSLYLVTIASVTGPESLRSFIIFLQGSLEIKAASESRASPACPMHMISRRCSAADDQVHHVHPHDKTGGLGARAWLLGTQRPVILPDHVPKAFRRVFYLSVGNESALIWIQDWGAGRRICSCSLCNLAHLSHTVMLHAWQHHA